MVSYFCSWVTGKNFLKSFALYHKSHKKEPLVRFEPITLHPLARFEPITLHPHSLAHYPSRKALLGINQNEKLYIWFIFHEI